MQKLYVLIVIYLAINLSGCVTAPVKVAPEYSRQERDGLYNLNSWAFDGRVAVVGKRESWQANIDWQRLDTEEVIRLSGPLGQGAVSIHITDTYIGVDEGNGEIKFDKNDDAQVAERLGFFVPVRSLRYWVLGLVEPKVPFEEVEMGFVQSGWVVKFKQMQQTEYGFMPYKINVSNQEVRLKLVIDRWQRNS